MHKVLIAGAILFGAGLIPFSDIEAKVGGGMDGGAVFAMHVERYHMDMQHMEDRTALTIRILQERIAMHEARLARQKERLTERTCDRLQRLQSRRSLYQELPAFCGSDGGEDSVLEDDVETPPDTEYEADAGQGSDTDQDTGSGEETELEQETGTEQGSEDEAGSGDTNDNTDSNDGTDTAHGDGVDTDTGADTDTGTDTDTESGTGAGADTENGAEEDSDTTGNTEEEGDTVSDPGSTGSHARLVISEVLYSLVTTQGSEAQGENEWIELFNGSDSSIDLNGYAIGDSAGKDVLSGDDLLLLPGAYVILTPEASTLTFWDMPEGTLTVIIGNKLGSNGLGNSGDAVFLYNVEGDVIDAMSYGTNDMVFPAGSLVAPKGSSLARVPVTVDTDTPNDWAVLDVPTPGR